ncbi:ribulose-phosphate 3-epimerase [Corynebacterium sp. sy017]|uniref:ribulose-phosphate 3-epimerase n=1 Tax=unclassified Corynebacterium TaxID=2624378 RepID=UPI001184D034|nr:MULTISPECIES: ribulose-phosphate 3-epimerase [unclassified Corynebacterium]MBP3087675.1 ribulose-phosphate 3-epimerase [Corynebacterium sp. sy017]TSD92235.1 ribulose-phosphate 3-epimerase [Corynebacterium sp. SY003]
MSVSRNNYERIPLIAPSVLAADFAQLDRELAKVDNSDWIHVDIMDGHFVPNLSFGADVTAALGRHTDKPLDVHLMIEQPHKWVDKYIAAGAHSITFHVEAHDDPVDLARFIRSHGVKAGFAVRPGTPIEDYLDVVSEFDEVIVMSVEPGFGGQKFMPEQLEKVRLLRNTIDEQALSTLIVIDGGISRSTIASAAHAGVDVFVAGSAVFGAADPGAEITRLRELARA